MQGILLSEFERFAESSLGPSSWRAIRAHSGLAGRVYLPVREYPDDELEVLVRAACHVVRKSRAELLERFGEFLVPGLLSVYGAMVKPTWRTLDVLEHAETVMHGAVRVRTPGAAPPRLHARRVAPNLVRIEYTSERRMCACARGIVQGLGAHFGETLVIGEPSCMLAGAARCELSIRLARPPSTDRNRSLQHAIELLEKPVKN